MLYRLGRFFQLLALLILPVGVAGNLARADLVGVRASLLICFGGSALFLLGWLLQQSARPP
jgi:hypothetical protein